jgi:hypothetical protein
LDSGHHGSGFPLPPFRAKLLEKHLAVADDSKPKKAIKHTPMAKCLSSESWKRFA